MLCLKVELLLLSLSSQLLDYSALIHVSCHSINTNTVEYVEFKGNSVIIEVKVAKKEGELTLNEQEIDTRQFIEKKVRRLCSN